VQLEEPPCKGKGIHAAIVLGSRLEVVLGRGFENRDMVLRVQAQGVCKDAQGGEKRRAPAQDRQAGLVEYLA
jgi:hypothetical protein